MPGKQIKVNWEEGKSELTFFAAKALQSKKKELLFED